MISRKKMWVALVVLVGGVFLGTALPAQASITLFISTNGGASYSSFTSGTSIVHGDVSGTGFDITVTGTSNQLNPVATQSQISQIQTTITTTAAVALPDIIIALSDQNFNQVTGSAILSSSISGTSGILTGSAASTFQSTMANSNKEFAGLTSTNLATAVVAAGLPTPGAATATVNNPPLVINTVLSGTQTISGNTATTATSATPLYSLSNQLDLSGITLGSGAQLNLTGTTTLSAVPAPGGVVLALTGLPFLGLGNWLRRRRTRA